MDSADMEIIADINEADMIREEIIDRWPRMAQDTADWLADFILDRERRTIAEARRAALEEARARLEQMAKDARHTVREMRNTGNSPGYARHTARQGALDDAESAIRTLLTSDQEDKR